MDMLLHGNVDNMNRLTARLGKIGLITNYGAEQPKSISYHLSEIEGIMNEIICDKIPEIMRDDISDEQLVDILSEIREDFDQLIYCIKTPEFFRYAFDRNTE